MIYAGNLTETLDFYSIQEVQSPSGFKEQEEVFKFSLRAQRLRNKEYIEQDNAGEVFHFSTLTFRCRKRKGSEKIKETDLVIYNDEKYRIASIDEYRDDQELKLQKINE